MDLIRKATIISVCMFIVFSPFAVGNSIADTTEIKKLYLEGKFGEISQKYKDVELEKIEKNALLIYLEAIIRNSESEKSLKLLKKVKSQYGEIPDILLLEGMYALSTGDLIKVSTIINSLFTNNVSMIRLHQLKFFDALYNRNFKEARIWLHKLKEHKSGFGKSNLFFLLSSGLYRSTKNYTALSSLYKTRMKEVKKSKGKNYYKNLKLNYKLYKRKSKSKYFVVNSIKDRVEIPFELGNKGSLKVISLENGGENFRILLDTGNTSGWIVHNRNLREKLKYFKGGRTIVQVGTEADDLDGFNILCKTVNFGDFQISGLFGNYIPKPHKDFFDANLNPAMISNRVVSFDFINNRLILRTYDLFFREIEKTTKMEVMKIPWYGYKYPMVPVLCNSKNGLAVLETGAKNISIKKSFAKSLRITFSERSKYLSNGNVFKYSLGPVNVQLGKYLFVRKNAEIWPLKQFKNRLSGFSPHLIIGPEALDGKFIVSIAPRNNIIVFEYEKRR